MSDRIEAHHFMNAAISDLTTIMTMNALLCKAKETPVADQTPTELYQAAINASRFSLNIQMKLLRETYEWRPEPPRNNCIPYERVRFAVAALEETSRIMDQLDEVWIGGTQKWRDIQSAICEYRQLLLRLEEILEQLLSLRDEFERHANAERPVGWKYYWNAYTRLWSR